MRRSCSQLGRCQSAETLTLLGFGKTVTYDTVVNDDLGMRFNGVGMGPMAGLKPLIFWVMLFLFVFVDFAAVSAMQQMRSGHRCLVFCQCVGIRIPILLLHYRNSRRAVPSYCNLSTKSRSVQGLGFQKLRNQFHETPLLSYVDIVVPRARMRMKSCSSLQHRRAFAPIVATPQLQMAHEELLVPPTRSLRVAKCLLITAVLPLSAGCNVHPRRA